MPQKALPEEIYSLNTLCDLDRQSLAFTWRGNEWIEVPTLQSSGLTKEQCLDLYASMQCARMLDKKMLKLKKQSLVFGKLLSSEGSEACAVGSAYALSESDWIFTAIRSVGAFLARGMTIEQIIAQAAGRRTSPTGGWDASVHMHDKNKKLIGLISHLGVMPCIAAGCAFAEQYKKEPNIALAFIGDAAMSSGKLHEMLNIAAVKHLPFVLVIENNYWGFKTPPELQSANPTWALSAPAYGKHIEGRLIDGTNILTVYETVRMAARQAREQGIITIIDAVHFRFQEHSDADSADYVPKDLLAEWLKKDPIARFTSLLLTERVADETELHTIDARIAEAIEQAAENVKNTPMLDGANIESNIFLPSPHHPTVLSVPPREGRRITYHEAIREAMFREMESDHDLFIIGEDIGHGGGAFGITEDFSRHFDGINPVLSYDWKHRAYPQQRRVIDAPLAEAGFTGLAIGAALAGLKVIVEFQYADFISDAFTMVTEYLATQIPRGLGPFHIVLRCPAGWAKHAAAYHCVNPESWFGGVPGLKIVAPITAFDAIGLFRAAIRDGNPVIFCEYKHHYRNRPETLSPELNCPIPETDYVVPIGQARVLKEGTDCTVITYGSQVFRALEAVRIVAEDPDTQGASVEVIDLRTIKPFDRECIASSIRKTGKALVTCEAQEEGCFGNTLVQFIQKECFNHLDAPIKLVAAANTPVPFAETLEQAHLPTKEKIASALKSLLLY